MDSAAECRGLAGILVAPNTAALSKVQVLARKTGATVDAKGANGWAREHIVLLQQQVCKLMGAIKWLQVSLQQEERLHLQNGDGSSSQELGSITTASSEEQTHRGKQDACSLASSSTEEAENRTQQTAPNSGGRRRIIRLKRPKPWFTRGRACNKHDLLELDSMEKRAARKLVSRYLKQERKRRIRAERKLSDLCRTLKLRKSMTEPVPKIDNENREPAKNHNASLESRIVLLNGTASRLVKELEGASCLMADTSSISVTTKQSGSKDYHQVKMRLTSMEQQLLALEDMAFQRCQEAEERLRLALEARASTLEREKRSLKQRLQNIELKKHEQLKLELQQQGIQASEHQLDEAASSEGFEDLRAEVQKLSSGVVNSLEKLRAKEQGRDLTAADMAMSKKERHREMVWRKGLVAFEQALLLCVAAFMLFSKHLHAPVLIVVPPT